MDAIAQSVWSELGPGYSESVYHHAFEIALRKKGIKYESEKIIPVFYDGLGVGNVRADIVLDNLVIELKSVAKLTEQFKIQLKNYLKLLGVKQGLLINFPLVESESPEIILCEYTPTLARDISPSTSYPARTISPLTLEEGSTVGTDPPPEVHTSCIE
jgi:GxxExxY protein